MESELVRMVIGFKKGFGTVYNVSREQADFFMEEYRYAMRYEKADWMKKLWLIFHRRPFINLILFDDHKKPLVVIDISEICMMAIEKEQETDQERLSRKLQKDVLRGEEWRGEMED